MKRIQVININHKPKQKDNQFIAKFARKGFEEIEFGKTILINWIFDRMTARQFNMIMNNKEYLTKIFLTKESVYFVFDFDSYDPKNKRGNDILWEWHPGQE